MAFNSAFGHNKGAYLGSQAHIECERSLARIEANAKARQAQTAGFNQGYDEGYNDAAREWQAAYQKLEVKHADVVDASIHNYKFGDQCKAEIAQLKQQLAQLQQANQQLQQQNQALQAARDARVPMEEYKDLVKDYNSSQDIMTVHAVIRGAAMDTLIELERQGRFSDNDYAEVFMPLLRSKEQIGMDNGSLDAPLLQSKNSQDELNKGSHIKAFLQHAEAQAQQAVKRKQPSQSYVMKY